MENKMEEKEKDGNYALNNFKDIAKYDPARLLDLGNSFQVLMSQKKPEMNEEARATSNFKKLTEDKPRPLSHTAVDITGRLLPTVVSALASAAVKGVSKGANAISKGVSKLTGKSIGKKTTKDIAKKLVSEKTSDAAQAFSKSMFLTRDAKVNASNKWVRNLLEDEEALKRAAKKVTSKKLSDEEVEAVRKGIKELIPNKIEKYNADADKLYDVWKRLNIKENFETKGDLVRYLNKNKKSLGLTDTEYKNLLENIDALTDAKIRHQRLPVDRITELKEENNVLRNIKEGVPQYVVPGALFAELEKPIEAFGNDTIKTLAQTNDDVKMSTNYYIKGSKPTPVADFVASVFDLDFDDPARFNKKEIDAFFEFLEKRGIIEPGIKDKWTPRQKVSVMREISKDKNLDYIKKDWAKSEYKKNLENNNNGE